MHQYESDVISVMSRDAGCLPDHIKQESHLAAKPCLETLTAASNGYCLPNGARDTWPTFRDGFSFSSGAADAKMVANMAAVTSSAGHMGQFGAVDWTSMGSRTQTAAGQYYGTPLAQATAYATPTGHHPAHHPYHGWTEAGHGHAQSAYAYGMTSPHSTYRQSESSPTSYPYSSFGSASSLSAGPVVKETLCSTPSIQDMENERTIRRARRNRTCFSKHQMESLEEVFKESRYPDVYRREEIAATLDLKEEVVRVWFKNRRAKMKRENKDGKVTSPGSPTSTTPSPKSSTSPSFPTSSTLYTPGAGSYQPPSGFPGLPTLKPDTPYFPTPYSGYTHPHSTMTADAGPSSSTPNLTKQHQVSTAHITSRHNNNNNHNHISDVTASYSSGRSDVTSTYNSVKCETTTSEQRDYTTSGGDLMTSPGGERPTPSINKSHHHPLSPTDANQ